MHAYGRAYTRTHTHHMAFDSHNLDIPGDASEFDDDVRLPPSA